MKNFFTGRAPLSPLFFWAACALICLLGLLLRLPNLGRSLWLDEAYSAWFSALPLHELWHSVPLYETHPPMYYTVLKGWTALFGNSEVALRSVSVLATLATVLLLAVSAKILRAGPIGDRVALLAALLLAANKGNIEYAQQARPYALETLTASIAILFSIVLLRSMCAQVGGRFAFRPLLPGMLGLGIGAGMTLWLHNTAILICFGLWAALVTTLLTLVPGRRVAQALAVAVPGIIALLIWSPFIPMFITQNTGLSGLSFWIVTDWKDPFVALGLITGGKFTLIPLTLLAGLGFAKLWRIDRASALNLAIVLILPLSVVLAYSYLRTPIFIDRLFEWLAPSVMALAALGVIAGIRQESARPWVVGVVMVLSLGAIYRHHKLPIEDWRAAVEHIAAHAQPGDLVIGSPNEVGIPLSYYIRRYQKFPDVLLMPVPFPALGMKDRIYVANLGAPVIGAGDREVVHAALQTHRRVWLLEVRPDLYDRQRVIRSEILSSRKPVTATMAGLTKIELFD